MSTRDRNPPAEGNPKRRTRAAKPAVPSRSAAHKTGPTKGSQQEQDSDPDDVQAEWIFRPGGELRPNQPLLDGVPADSSFAGITLEQLQSMPPLPRVPAAYRHDMLVDCPPSQTDSRIWEDFEHDSARDDTRAELERLQIETIVGLVDSLEVEVGGARLKRKLLFLSNKQACLLPLDNIDKVMSGLDFYPRPKLVIQLVASTAAGFGQSMVSLLIEHHWTDCVMTASDLNTTHYFVSEKDGLNGLRETEYKIQTFLKESLIPLARQHTALVIVSNSACSFSQVFGKICAAEAERRKGNLGFYVLAFLEAPHFLVSCKNPDTIVFQLRKASKNWRKVEDKMMYVQKKTQGDESMFYNHYMDAPDGCTHYIVADCISEDEDGLKRDWAPIHVLRARLVQAMLSNQIPGFGVATLQRPWGYMDVRFLADLVARGIPLLLLDSRDRPLQKIESVEAAVSHLSDLDEELAKQGIGNFYHTSSLAFLHQTLLGLLRRRGGAFGQRLHVRSSLVSDIVEGTEEASANDSRTPLWQQVSSLQAEMEVDDASVEPTEGLSGFKDAKHSLAQRLSRGFLTMMGSKVALIQVGWDISEIPKDHFKDMLLRTVGELLRCDSREALDTFLEYFSLLRLSVEHLHKIMSFRNSPFCVKHGMKAGTLFKKIIQVAPDANWEDAMHYIFSCLKEDCRHFDDKFHCRSHLPHSPEIRASFSEVLVSPLTHSANLSDIPQIEKVLMRLNMDRSVDGMGLSSCQVLQRAWADVDVYHVVASRMKWVAKICYAFLLLAGYSITVLTVTRVNRPDVLSEEETNYIVLGLSVSVAMISALMAHVEPTAKWQQLRAAALALEAEIWKFRCGAGLYTKDMLSNQLESAEETFAHFVSATEDALMKSAGISESSFLSRFSFSRTPTSASIYKHGQYEGASWMGEYRSDIVDDHYSPLTAREYMTLRFNDQIEFYTKRLPVYARVRALHQTVLALASGLLTVFVFLGSSQWCALITGGVAAATAWIEFSSIKLKMRRYSETVHRAHQILLWWQSLQRIQQTANFTGFVQRCEECFASENCSWASSLSAQQDGKRKLVHDHDGTDDVQKDIAMSRKDI